ncbi:hypothetical protein SARC_00269 [Sphaeroforma arctica JP610]|uniref:BHLH domain-containing protein n=1 Tax=Sphaeroforma arctica JP610 TaxID=667725 RepID=A0A0L0GFM0_9EUKA|nr:hypothetical protein SARC_00269 [Sphaeroforma arctica JP610]KNC87639.1 hypothetical protein SARC_00269 [Sphaeroforma arctica JP610]|eukprot:XP_014161541.1 hypothetical protein SARC_00269 [Sphaeroforma arctica JP610]
MTNEVVATGMDLPPQRGSLDMTALLHAAELLRLEEEGTLDPKTLASYGLDREKFYGCVAGSYRSRSVSESGLPIYGTTNQQHNDQQCSSTIEQSYNSGSSTHSTIGKTKKRSIKNREMHNLLEKNRRAHLKSCFDDLRDSIPGLEDGKQSTVLIIEKASKHITGLSTKHKQQLAEINRLRHLNQWCAEKLLELGGMDTDEFASVQYECTRSLLTPESETGSTHGSSSESHARQRTISESSASMNQHVLRTMNPGISSSTTGPTEQYPVGMVIPTSS